jgi:glutathione S-transferase
MSEPSGPTNTLRLERTFAAPPERVFDAWTSAEVLRRWYHAETDWETPFAHVDLRIGGSVRVTMRNPHDGTEIGGGGQYTIIDRPRYLAFTWAWDGDDATRRQLIEVEFLDEGDHTRVILTNSGLPTGELDDYRDGWNNSFDNLVQALRA